jgi:hypothetical protein
MPTIAVELPANQRTRDEGLRVATYGSECPRAILNLRYVIAIFAPSSGLRAGVASICAGANKKTYFFFTGRLLALFLAASLKVSARCGTRSATLKVRAEARSTFGPSCATRREPRRCDSDVPGGYVDSAEPVTSRSDAACQRLLQVSGVSNSAVSRCCSAG